MSSKIDDDPSSISSQDEQQSDEESAHLLTGSWEEEIVENGWWIIRCCYCCFSLENSERSYLRECPCQSHLATQLINRTYGMSVDRLFDYVFGQNDFLTTFRAARRIKGCLFILVEWLEILFFCSLWKDYQAEEWQINAETGKRERFCSYKVTVTAVFGSSVVCSNERQVSNEDKRSIVFFSYVRLLDYRNCTRKFSLYHRYGSAKRRNQIFRCILYRLSLLFRANWSE